MLDPRTLQIFDDFAGSVHEAAHAVLARHYGLHVTTATLWRVGVEHARYKSADAVEVDQRLTLSAAGDVASVKWAAVELSGVTDFKRSMILLHALGVNFKDSLGRIAKARREAERLCIELKPQIFRVAAALRDLRMLTTIEIDAAIEGGNVLAKLVKSQTDEAIEMKAMAHSGVQREMGRC